MNQQGFLKPMFQHTIIPPTVMEVVPQGPWKTRFLYSWVMFHSNPLNPYLQET